MLLLLICRIISVHMDGRFTFVVQLGLGEFQKQAFKHTARVKVSIMQLMISLVRFNLCEKSLLICVLSFPNRFQFWRTIWGQLRLHQDQRRIIKEPNTSGIDFIMFAA